MNDENQNKLSLLKGFEDAMMFLTKRHKNLVILHSDFGSMLGLSQLSGLYGERLFNFGLAEANMIAASAGFVLRGKIPVVVGLANFCAGKAWEQIRNMICYPNLNVKIIGVGAGFSMGNSGSGFEALEDVTLMRALPNMKVINPCDYYEVLSATKVMFDNFGPVYMRLPVGEYPTVYDDGCNFKFEKAEYVFGYSENEICIFSSGVMLYSAIKTAEMMTERGLKVSVANISSIKPLDKEFILKVANKAELIVTIEDHNLDGGMGSAIMEIVSEYSPVKTLRIGVENSFGESGKENDLLRKHGLESEALAAKIIGFLKGD